MCVRYPLRSLLQTSQGTPQGRSTTIKPFPLTRPDSGFSVIEKSVEAAAGSHADGPEPDDPPPPSTYESADSPTKAFLLFILCLLMHAILVGIHLALVILRFKVHGDEFKISDQRFNNVTEVLFYYITGYPNIIIKVYLVPLLFVTQKLALKKDLHQKQTLTAMHDKSAAWLSLGVTAATIWKYRNLLRVNKPTKEIWQRDIAAFGGVVCILLYLGGCLGLGLLAPDLITLGGTVGNISDVVSITSLLPDIGQDSNQLQEAFPIVDIIPLVDDDLATTGLEDNVIYDIPNSFTFTVRVNGVASTVPVNGAAFIVNCGKIPGLTQAGRLNATSGAFAIHVHDELQDIQVFPTSRTMNVRGAQWRNTTSQRAPPPVIFVASTFRVVDDLNETVDALVSLDPAVSPASCFISSDCSAISSVQVLGCNISSKHFNDIQVFTDLFPLQIDGSNVTYSEASWNDWSLPNVASDPTLALVGNFPDFSPASRTAQSFSFQGENVSKTYTLSMLEDNFMEALGYYEADVAQTTIGDVQEVLGEAIAAVFWRAAVRRINSGVPQDDSQGPNFTDTIKISKWTPGLGLAVSVVMLMLAIIVTRQPLPAQTIPRAHVDGVGVLELTWLLGEDLRKGKNENKVREDDENMGLAERLAHAVSDPTVENLRNEGKKLETAFCV